MYITLMGIKILMSTAIKVNNFFSFEYCVSTFAFVTRFQCLLSYFVEPKDFLTNFSSCS